MRRALALPHALPHALLAPLALLATVPFAGCPKDSPPLSIAVAPTYGNASECGIAGLLAGLPGDKSLVRLSVRSKNDSGEVIGICDAPLKISEPSIWGFPIAATRVDLFVEVFGGASKTERIASGALLDVAATDLKPRNLLVYESEKYSCTKETRLNIPRAFHTATRLRSGHVLFIGGLTTNADGKDSPAPNSGTQPKFFATSTIEVYDPILRTISLVAETGTPMELPARAFHRTVVVKETSDGKHTLLVIGGARPVNPAIALVNTTDGTITENAVPNNFRLRLEGNSDQAPAQLIVFDSKASPPTVTRMEVAGLKDVSLVLQGATQLAEGGALVVGGMQYGKAPLAQPLIGAVRDGMTPMTGMLSKPRSGAALVGLTDANAKTASALLIGGASAGMDGASPFERIDLGTLKSTAVTSSLAMPALYLPTATLMDAATAAAPRVLISGGLEVIGSNGLNNGLATNPIGRVGATMYQVIWSPSAPMLQTSEVVAKGFGASRCTAGTDHYKVAAFDAATLVKSGDRVLVTGGTPRNDKGEPCRECEGGDDLFACALGQAVMVSVPASPAEAPVMVPANRLSFPRFGHSQTLLEDGTVLIVGGLTRRAKESFAVAQTEIFNPARAVSAAARARGENAAEPDDPLLDDILAAQSPTVREPGVLMHAPGMADTPTRSCIAPSK